MFTVTPQNKIDKLHPTKLDLIYFSIFNYLNQ